MSNDKLRILMNNNILRYTGSFDGVIENELNVCTAEVRDYILFPRPMLIGYQNH